MLTELEGSFSGSDFIRTTSEPGGVASGLGLRFHTADALLGLGPDALGPGSSRGRNASIRPDGRPGHLLDLVVLDDLHPGFWFGRRFGRGVLVRSRFRARFRTRFRFRFRRC